VDEEVWVELEWDVYKILWAEFPDRFSFGAGVKPEDWPAAVEPIPSVAWDLGPIFNDQYPVGFAAGMRDVAALVLGTLQDCTQWWEHVAFHDWVHPSRLFRPHNGDVPEGVPGWGVGGLFTNGDYTISVSRDYAFGFLEHPWEHSLCVFGEPAVAAFAARNRGVATTVLRRDGKAAR